MKHCPLYIIELINIFRTFLPNLSKAFDCFNHFLEKLYFHKLSPLSLKLMTSYLENRSERTKISESFGNRSK